MDFLVKYAGINPSPAEISELSVSGTHNYDTIAFQFTDKPEGTVYVQFALPDRTYKSYELPADGKLSIPNEVLTQSGRISINVIVKKADNSIIFEGKPIIATVIKGIPYSAAVPSTYATEFDQVKNDITGLKKSISDLTGVTTTSGTTWLFLSGTPTPTTGNVGNVAVNTAVATKPVYRKLSTGWTQVGNLAGTGAAEAGTTLLDGDTDPLDTTGVNGNFYIQRTTHKLYKKTAGAWHEIGNVGGDPVLPDDVVRGTITGDGMRLALTSEGKLIRSDTYVTSDNFYYERVMNGSQSGFGVTSAGESRAYNRTGTTSAVRTLSTVAGVASSSLEVTVGDTSKHAILTLNPDKTASMFLDVPMDMSNNKIVNLADPVADTDAVNFAMMKRWINQATAHTRLMGTLDCSTNPLYPRGVNGDGYIVSVAGKIGGINGVSVQVYDMVICTLGEGMTSQIGDQASVGANWTVIAVPMTGYIVGPPFSNDDMLAAYSGTSGKILKGAGLTVAQLNTYLAKAQNAMPRTGGVFTGAVDMNGQTLSGLVDNVTDSTAVGYDAKAAVNVKSMNARIEARIQAYHQANPSDQPTDPTHLAHTRTPQTNAIAHYDDQGYLTPAEWLIDPKTSDIVRTTASGSRQAIEVMSTDDSVGITSTDGSCIAGLHVQAEDSKETIFNLDITRGASKSARLRGHVGEDGVGYLTHTNFVPVVNNKITMVTDPTAAQDAATKNYVDTKIAAVVPGGAVSNIDKKAITFHVYQREDFITQTENIPCFVIPSNLDGYIVTDLEAALFKPGTDPVKFVKAHVFKTIQGTIHDANAKYYTFTAANPMVFCPPGEISNFPGVIESTLIYTKHTINTLTPENHVFHRDDHIYVTIVNPGVDASDMQVTLRCQKAVT